jgi:hypothetical protein
MNIRFGAKDAPFIRTSGTKKTPSENSTIFLHIWGVNWGGGMENVGKNALNFDYLGRYERY